MYSFRNMPMRSLRSVFVCLFLLSFLRISSAATLGTVTPSRSIRDGETLVSAGGGFELGFFSPGNSEGRYSKIWYTVFVIRITTLTFLDMAWMLWMQDKQLELIDKTLSDSGYIYEVVRCLHVGLLCVQRVPEDRPSLSFVVLMLSSDVALPSPKQPGFYTERSVTKSPSSTRPCSENNVSITLIEPR